MALVWAMCRPICIAVVAFCVDVGNRRVKVEVYINIGWGVIPPMGICSYIAIYYRVTGYAVGTLGLRPAIHPIVMAS